MAEVAFIVRNTFIDVVSTSAPPCPSVQRRCNSAPPGPSRESSEFESTVICDFDTQLGHKEECATTPLLSPRSEDSTTASSDNASPAFPGSDSDQCVHQAAFFSPRSDDSTTASSDNAAAPAFARSDSDQESSDPSTDDSIDRKQEVEADDFYICVNKLENPQLGIDVQRDGEVALVIRSVSKGGLVHKWNQDNPSLQVCPGNHIVAVNGVCGSAADMLRECQRREVLKMRVLSNANSESLAALVSTLRNSRFRRRDTKLTTAPSGATSTSASSRAMASNARVGSQGTEVVRSAPQLCQSVDSLAACGTQRCPPPPKPVAFRVPELSLSKLLPLEAKVGQQEALPLACRRTKLKSSAPAFAPTFGAPEAVAGGELIVARDGSRGEISWVLKSVAQAVTFNQDVKSIQVVESELGSSAAINIELRLPSAGSADVRALAKSALLDAAGRSQTTYVVGYLEEPFVDVGESSFKAALAMMRSKDRACWDFYGKGRCLCREACPLRHPSADDLMVVWVNLQHPVGKY